MSTFNPYDTSRGEAQARVDDLCDRTRELEDLRLLVAGWQLAAAKVSCAPAGTDVSTPAAFLSSQVVHLAALINDREKLRDMERSFAGHVYVKSEEYGRMCEALGLIAQLTGRKGERLLEGGCRDLAREALGLPKDSRG